MQTPCLAMQKIKLTMSSSAFTARINDQRIIIWYWIAAQGELKIHVPDGNNEEWISQVEKGKYTETAQLWNYCLTGTICIPPIYNFPFCFKQGRPVCRQPQAQQTKQNEKQNEIT